MGLTRCYKTAVFVHLYLLFFYHNLGLCLTLYFRFWKRNDAILEFYFRFRFWPCIVSCMWFCFGLPNFIRIGPPMVELWRFCLVTSGTWERQRLSVYQSTAEILLLPVYISKRLPAWKYASTFHFDHFTTTRMWLCVGIPNFIWMGRSVTDLWRHIDFPRWRPRRQKSTSGLVMSRTWEC